MNESRTEQVAVPGNWDHSVENLNERVEEFYKPWEPGEEKWFRCQRSEDDGTVCGRKCFFPHGVVSHENHHSINSGNGPLISQSQSDDSTSEEPKITNHNTSEVEGEILESIESEFDG